MNLSCSLKGENRGEHVLFIPTVCGIACTVAVGEYAALPEGSCCTYVLPVALVLWST